MLKVSTQQVNGAGVLWVIHRRKVKGFTLLELMITLTVAGVILAVGIPSYNSFVQNNRAVTHSNDVVTALNYARSEATRRGVPIVLCSSSNGTACSGSTVWGNGWIARRPSGVILRTWPARSGGSGVLTANVSQIQFEARGSLATGTVPVLQVRLPDCSGSNDRDVAVNRAGRVSITRVDCT